MPIEVGAEAPDFVLKDQNNQEVRLSDFRGRKNVLLVFYHKVWAEREGFDFPLLADFWPHGAVAQAYGVFNSDRGIANRGTFVIDKAGVVRFGEMNGPGEARDQDAWRKALSSL